MSLLWSALLLPACLCHPHPYNLDMQGDMQPSSTPDTRLSLSTDTMPPEGTSQHQLVKAEGVMYRPLVHTEAVTSIEKLQGHHDTWMVKLTWGVDWTSDDQLGPHHSHQHHAGTGATVLGPIALRVRRGVYLDDFFPTLQRTMGVSHVNPVQAEVVPAAPPHRSKRGVFAQIVDIVFALQL